MCEIECGEFYIYDLLGYLERKYMSTSVRELKKYIYNFSFIHGIHLYI